MAGSGTLSTLGMHKIYAGWVYINKLADRDVKVLENMIGAAVKREQPVAQRSGKAEINIQFVLIWLAAMNIWKGELLLN